MARQETIQLVDDMDGGTGADVKTVQFGLDGVVYEIDIDDVKETRLRHALAEYAGAARRANGKNLQKRHAEAEPPRPRAQGADHASSVRAWALANGIEVEARGRIPKYVEAKYQAAQQTPRTRRKPRKT